MQIQQISEGKFIIELDAKIQKQILPAGRMYENFPSSKLLIDMLDFWVSAWKSYNADNYNDMFLNLGKLVALSLRDIENFCADKDKLFDQVNKEMQ